MRWMGIWITGLFLLLPSGLARAGDEDPLERARQVAKLRGLVRETLDIVEADEGVQALRSLGRLRDELDRRRDRALAAIFHPVEREALPPASATARTLQRIVERRVAAVREIWDEPRRVELGVGTEARARLRHLGQLLHDLARHGDLAPRLRAAAGVLPLYAQRSEIGIRDYFQTGEEGRAQEYDRWVQQTYNAARADDLGAEAREQVRLTNEYRRMIGIAAQVEAKTDLVDGMDEAALVNALDAATITKRTPIRALRIDKRLVASATAHARSMATGGYFSHMVPSQVASDGGRSPRDRILHAGYEAEGMSENLAAGGGGAAQVTLMWQQSRAQHQVLLGAWSDIGVGHADRRWVQNLAFGDGGPMVPQPDLTPRKGPR